MKMWARMVVGIVLVSTVAGCRAATQVIEEPRADFDIPTGGNRGYVIGTPPTLSDARKMTRQMVEAEVETPPLVRGGGAPPAELSEATPSEADMSEQAAGETGEGSAVQASTTYTVQQGETLWSIAAKPEVFGDATQWRRLYRMNQDILKSPNRLRPGMTIKIPEGGSRGSAATASSEPAATFTK